MYKLMGYENQNTVAIKYLIIDTDDGVTELISEAQVTELLKAGVYIKGLSLGKTRVVVDDYSEVVRTVEQFALDAPKIMSKLKVSGVDSTQVIESLKNTLKSYGLITTEDTLIPNFKLSDGIIYLTYQKTDIHYTGAVRMSRKHTAYDIDVEWYTSGNSDNLNCVYADLISGWDTVANYMKELDTLTNKNVSSRLAFVGIHTMTGKWCVITEDGTLYDFSMGTLRQASQWLYETNLKGYVDYIAEKEKRGVLARVLTVISWLEVSQIDSSLSIEEFINAQYYDKLRNVFVADFVDKDKLAY